ncbi:MAG: hypothetical protein R2912_08765 [Eubacteriales bacterium]
MERPYYWAPYGYDAQGRITHTEVWKNAFAETFSGKTGHIYRCEADKAMLRFPDIRASGSPAPVPVSRSDKIDLYAGFLERERDGKLVIQRYESLTPDQLSLWHGMVPS